MTCKAKITSSIQRGYYSYPPLINYHLPSVGYQSPLHFQDFFKMLSISNRHGLLSLLVYIWTTLLAFGLIVFANRSMSIPGTLRAAKYSLSIPQDVGLVTESPIVLIDAGTSLCNSKPDPSVLEVPKGTDSAILLQENETCSFDDITKNVVDWYQKDNSNLKYIMASAESMTSVRNMFAQLRAKFRRLEKVNIDQQLPIALFVINQDTAKSFRQSMSLSEDAKSLTIMFKNNSFEKSTFKQKITFYARDFVVSMIITTVSLSVTLLVLTRCWGSSFSIEVSWRGMDLVYLAPDSPPDPKKLISKEQVYNLPETKYCDEASDEENVFATNSTCPICIEDFENCESLRVLPCGHLHHTDCIMPWLTTRQATCPMCKESLCKEVDKKDC